MGGIWMSGGALVGAVAETAGYKTGLALTRKELRKLFVGEPHLKPFWPRSFDQVVRIRSEVYEKLFAWVLYKLGNIESPSIEPVNIRLFRKYWQAGLEAEYDAVLVAFTDFLKHKVIAVAANPSEESKLIDPTPLVEELSANLGPRAASMALELFIGWDADQHRSPWGPQRQVEWHDQVELRGLFKEEGLETAYGHFFDQRFIDYLHRNFGEIDGIHWRKFEGLAAEYLARSGYEVQLGPGRGDDGVDARAWAPGTTTGEAPTLLIQAKRQKEKVSKVIVKGLYADVQHEKAKSGMIVTTSTLSPGALKTCQARSYPIVSADRRTLAEWLSKMRSPGAGVFLAE